MEDLAALRTPALPDRLQILGFRPDDAAAVAEAARIVRHGADLGERVAACAANLRSRIGAFLHEPAPSSSDPFSPLTTDEGDDVPQLLANGALAVLALVATSGAVSTWHASRGIPDDVSQATLADLGWQVAQHRRSTGGFGLQAPGQLLPHWQGSLHQVGRLQLDLNRVRAGRRAAALPEQVRAERWFLTVHVPETGPLRSRAVDASFDRARPFFDEHFGGTDPRWARCTSWLLDPHLATVLPAESHVVRFQRRFTPYGTASVGDHDILWSTFGRRGLDDLDELAATTGFERAVLDRIRSGEHWQLVQGWTRLPDPPSS